MSPDGGRVDFQADELSPLREECGVFGIWNHREASQLAYLGLYAMQHRGQESAGIVALHQGEHLHHKGLGLVSEVFTEDRLRALQGSAAIGHVRYSTFGRNYLANAQPLTAMMSSGPLAVAHNGNLVNAAELKGQLKTQGAIFSGTNDTEAILHLLARSPSRSLEEALREVLPRCQGAYSLTFLTHDRLVAVRDPLGFRPLVLGQMPGDDGKTAWVVASESCALDLVGASLVREVEPAEILTIDASGLHSSFLPKAAMGLARCIFEHVYFARPDSVVFSESSYEVRKQMGRHLAQESGVEADLVIPVPDSGVPAAIGYSQESGLPFEFGIIRNHYVGRTFIQPQQSQRVGGVRVKLNPQPPVLRGKRVIVIDDSLVRGTTSQKIVSLIRQAGAREVHLRISAPPTVGPCYYGVDTPDTAELVASHMSVDEIQKLVGADTLAYLSVEGLHRSVRVSEGFCSACFTRKYPTPIPGSAGQRTW